MLKNDLVTSEIVLDFFNRTSQPENGPKFKNNQASLKNCVLT